MSFSMTEPDIDSDEDCTSLRATISMEDNSASFSTKELTLRCMVTIELKVSFDLQSNQSVSFSKMCLRLANSSFFLPFAIEPSVVSPKQLNW